MSGSLIPEAAARAGVRREAAEPAADPGQGVPGADGVGRAGPHVVDVHVWGEDAGKGGLRRGEVCRGEMRGAAGAARNGGAGRRWGGNRQRECLSLRHRPPACGDGLGGGTDEGGRARHTGPGVAASYPDVLLAC